MKPVIAVTPEAIRLPSRNDGRGAFCGVSYSEAIEMAGGVPLILPLTRDRTVLDWFVTHCDGLLLTGGGDVSHKFYAPRIPARLRTRITGVDDVRDEMEIYLVRAAVNNNWPALGICRGIQVMNVALGGTLLPDIPGHRNAQPAALCQTIRWQRKSNIHRAINRQGSRVNTSHHQALDKIARELSVVARADDGVVEAVEHSTARLFWGVQFHPERLVNVAPEFLRLFRVFIAAAGRRLKLG